MIIDRVPFSRRFVRLPGKIYNSKQESLLGKPEYECETIDIYLRIDPYQIESYREGIGMENPFEEKYLTQTILIMKSHETHLIFLTIQEFEARMNDFFTTTVTYQV